jgi:hypothetical protein
MPSLIYVARVTPLPSRLIQHLQSAGFHVQSFGPGQITTDECLMVITPEALPAGLGPLDSAAAVTGPAQETTCRPQDVPPLPGLRPHLGLQPTIWNSVRQFAVKGSSSRPAATALPISGLEPGGLASNLNGIDQPALLSPPPRSASTAPLEGACTSRKRKSPILRWMLPSLKTRMVFARISAMFLGTAPRSGEEVHFHGRWPSLAAAMALMFLAVVLLMTRRASTFGSTSTDLTNRSGRSASDLPNSAHASSLSSSGALKVPASAQRRFYDDDFVAQDFTNHFDLRSQSRASPQNPELRGRAQSSLKPKRIVVD